MLNILFALVLILSIAGCSTPGVRVTVKSNPDAAYITSGGGVSGIAPVVGFWDEKLFEKASRNERGCFQLRGFTATWASGAVSEVPHIQVCGSTDGYYELVMSRDMNHPNLEKDLQFALQVQAVRVQQAQSEASQMAAAAAMWSATKVGQTTQRPFNCSSYNLGGTVQTNCQ